MQDITSLTKALKTSSLKDLLAQVLSQVKAFPQDLKAREVLFKLYCLMVHGIARYCKFRR
jgi:hypothetical protein